MAAVAADEENRHRMHGQRVGRQRIVNRGEVRVSTSEVLCVDISTCVAICLYHPAFGVGGLTHISRSRASDTTPSGRFLKTDGFHYTDVALQELLRLLRKSRPATRPSSLSLVVCGGLNNEGPIQEALLELERHPFRPTGTDINRGLYRRVRFDTASGTVHVTRSKLVPGPGGRKTLEPVCERRFAL
jgi:chemotaxis receptor (MCP) glutamine deamidase CheD